MNRDELRRALALREVNECLYSIDKLADQSESYSVVRVGDGWSVLYKERGEFIAVAAGLTEDQACNLLHEKFADAFCWSQKGTSGAW